MGVDVDVFAYDLGTVYRLSARTGPGARFLHHLEDSLYSTIDSVENEANAVFLTPNIYASVTALAEVDGIRIEERTQ